MKRSMMQVFVRGSAGALEFYRRAFGATVLCAYPDGEGRLMHSELDIQGQILAVSELTGNELVNSEEAITGNTMMFCLHYGEGGKDAVRAAYEVLKTDAKISSPLGPCEYSPLMAALVDRYGVTWCIFV